MKEKLRNKKVVYTIIGIVSVLLVMIAVTYAYWLVTKTQTNENVISSACLDISISGEENDITLSNQFPMSDEDGMKLVPYEFTVTNNCNTSVDYQVALEATGDSANALAATSLKIALNDSAKLYNAYPSVDTTISGAYGSRVLGYSRLAASGSEGSSDTYELRIWIDADAPISEMNKTFKSKISVTVGQGIESPYEEGTLAYDILANYSGVNAISEIDTKGEYVKETNSYSTITTSSNYYYGTEYIFDESTEKYTLSGTLTQATIAECRNGTKTCGKYTLKNTSSTYSSAYLYEIEDFSTGRAQYIKYKNDFTDMRVNEVGLYKTQDDLGDSYYFRGIVNNNYVELGKYKENGPVVGYAYDGAVDFSEYSSLEECKAASYNNYNCSHLYKENDSMYWRIVRINGDGTIRLAYDGTVLSENSQDHVVIIGNSVFNSNTNDPKYAGYTYDDGTGTQVDSIIKSELDTWYKNNLENEYNNIISDSIFCNDREILNPNEISVKFAGYNRLYKKGKMPSLKCANKADRYTVNDTINGNGLLLNPIGLLTADEANLGANYLLSGPNAYYWTSTPSDFMGDYSESLVFTIELVEQVGVWPTTFSRGVRPVINLKSDVEFTGDGTIDNPYKIVTD